MTIQSRIGRVLLTALAGVVLLAGCARPDMQHVAGDAAPVGRAPVDLSPHQDTRDPALRGTPVNRDDRSARGGTLWAVVYGISDVGPDSVDTSHTFGRPVDGSSIPVLSVDCDPGARDGLGLRPDRSYWYAVYYFLNQEAAFNHKKETGRRFVGIVPVKPTLSDNCPG